MFEISSIGIPVFTQKLSPPLRLQHASCHQYPESDLGLCIGLQDVYKRQEWHSCNVLLNVSCRGRCMVHEKIH